MNKKLEEFLYKKSGKIMFFNFVILFLVGALIAYHDIQVKNLFTPSISEEVSTVVQKEAPSEFVKLKKTFSKGVEDSKNNYITFEYIDKENNVKELNVFEKDLSPTLIKTFDVEQKTSWAWFLIALLFTSTIALFIFHLNVMINIGYFVNTYE